MWEIRKLYNILMVKHGKLMENGKMELGESWDMMGSSDIYCCSDSVSQKLDIA
jgi:hypothetical protein